MSSSLDAKEESVSLSLSLSLSNFLLLLFLSGERSVTSRVEEDVCFFACLFVVVAIGYDIVCLVVCMYV